MNSLVSLYGRLPVTLQNAAFSVWGLKARRERYGRTFHFKLAELRESEWWPKGKIAAYQDEQVRARVAHAYQTVPAYRLRMDSAGVRAHDVRGLSDLQLLPILTKQEVKASPEEFLSDAYDPRRLRKGLTSGTTGSPLTVYLTPEALQFQWAVWWRHRARFGIELGDRFLMFGARLPLMPGGEKPPIWRTNRAINQVYLSTYHLTPQTMPDVVEWLNTQEFRFFTGYPSAMYVLAQFIRESGLSLARFPDHVVSGSDALIPAFEKTIGEVFNAPVTDQYGSAEACGNFARCEYGKYHLDAEFCAVELLPVEGSPDPRLRRLIFTGFANPAMPFIRYDQGDLGWVSDQPCQCGRATITLDRIEGRTEDYVRTPDGRMAIGMNQVFEWAPHLVEAQIRQDDISSIDVLIVPSKDYSKSDEQILERELRARLGHDIVIRFHLVDSIPRAKNGKFRAVVSSLAGRSEGEAQLGEAVRGDSH